jgi:general stress protein 26
MESTTSAQKQQGQTEPPAQAHAHLRTLMRSFRTAMLVTHAADGTLRARPMAVAAVDDDGSVWFVTSDTTPKVAEAQQQAQVNVCFQDGEAKAVSLSGTAECVDDRAKLDALWSEAWRVYFPQGRDTPSIVLMRVAATAGEYWDQSTFSHKLRFVVEAGKAYLSGRSAEPARLGDHEKVQLHA